MEGIFGILSFHSQVERPWLQKMAQTLGHTPQTYFHNDGQFGLGMQRLPLIASIQAPEPFLSNNGSLCVALNGEINNYHELRRDLEHRGHVFISNSDTELIANLYLDKGEDFLRELNGLFAVAIWDRRHQEIILAQDRYAGIRQLYYVQLPDGFIFASGIRPILGSGRVVPEVDTDSLVEFFSIGRVLPPHCLFKGIRKLIPGHVLKCRQGAISSRRVYGFSFTPKIERGDTHRLEELITGSMEKNVTADQPPGFLLSGGLDSSLNIATASRLCDLPLDTFCLGFSDAAFDESHYARLIAEHFKTNHREHFLESSSALEILPQLVWCQEEPISDYSAVPSYHLARFAKNFVNAVVAGDGPDHLWGRVYILLERYRFIHSVPGHQLLRKLSTDVHLSKYFPFKAVQRVAHYAHKTVESAYLASVARDLGNTPGLKSAPGMLSASIKTRWDERIDLADLFPGDITDDFNRLVNCDFMIDGSFGVFSKFGKVAAEHSLLVREPYLDNSLVDYINCLPEIYKIRGNLWQRLKGTAARKYLMSRDLGQSYLPRKIISKTKAGFTPPMLEWLREYLEQNKYGVDSLLSPSIRQAKFFDTAYVSKMVGGYLNKPLRNSFPLYMMLSFAVWHRLYIEDFTAAGPSATLTELLKA